MSKQLPIIDWEYGKKLSGGREDIAREMIIMLKEALPNDFAVIKTAFEKKDLAAMQTSLHKLHGAVSYCGVPTLKQTIAYLELALKKKLTENLPVLFAKFEQIVKQFLVETHEQL